MPVAVRAGEKPSRGADGAGRELVSAVRALAGRAVQRCHVERRSGSPVGGGRVAVRATLASRVRSSERHIVAERRGCFVDRYFGDLLPFSPGLSGRRAGLLRQDSDDFFATCEYISFPRVSGLPRSGDVGAE